MDEVTLWLEDLEDTRVMIAACLTYFSAQDVLKAQQQMGRIQKSTITLELERVKERLDGVLGDYLLNKHEAGQDEAEGEEEEETAEELEPLSPTPLGEFHPPQQTGTRVLLVRPEP